MLVSVTIPAYNAAEYLREAIESVLRQTLQPDEIIVVDDGSTDHTREVCASFGEKVKYFYQENDGIGGGGARAHATRMASGEWIAMLDHDDRWLPEKLEKQFQAVAQFPDAMAVLTFVQVIDADGQIVPEWENSKWGKPSGKVYQLLPRDAFHIQLEQPNFCPSTSLVRRSFLLKHGDRDLTEVGVGDWDLGLSLTRVHPIVIVEQFLTQYRISTAQYCVDKLTLGLALQRTLEQHRQHLHADCAECREGYRQGQAFVDEVKAVGARASLDQYHSIARSGHMSRSLPFLWGALRSAPREVLSPRRAAAIMKTGVMAGLKAVTPADRESNTDLSHSIRPDLNEKQRDEKTIT